MTLTPLIAAMQDCLGTIDLDPLGGYPIAARKTIPFPASMEVSWLGQIAGICPCDADTVQVAGKLLCEYLERSTTEAVIVFPPGANLTVLRALPTFRWVPPFMVLRYHGPCGYGSILYCGRWSPGFARSFESIAPEWYAIGRVKSGALP